jgi:hypothetical protein
MVEYLNSEFEPDAEYVNGEIEERNSMSGIIMRSRRRFCSGSTSTITNGKSGDCSNIRCKNLSGVTPDVLQGQFGGTKDADTVI